ncbi:MAG: T9SS type A sorting domain-containing protein [Candidatus Cloacimonetes bacterium]|nr:T9SS type A sorting domain-containing protein [Candidatus Cloacimonadota bacterium]
MGSPVSDEDEVFPIYTSKLIGNYPNPFNPETTIRFSVATEGNVIINVYNVKGQKVKNLVNGDYNTGMHSIIWNGLSDNGQMSGAGVYFYQMFTNDNVDVKRMLLLK